MSAVIPEGYKRCSKGDNCLHPEGPVLPATLEYFRKHTQNGWQAKCRYCLSATEAKRSKKSRNKLPSAPPGHKACSSNDECLHPQGPLLPLSEFSPRQKSTSGFEGKCKACLREYMGRYRHGDEWEERKQRRQHFQSLAEQYGKGYMNLVQVHRYRARKQELPATFSLEQWAGCLDYWQHLCAYCGKPRDLWNSLAQEHFVPVSSNGGYTADNIVPACKYCNSSKLGSDPHEWVIAKFGKRKGKEILARIEAYFEWTRQREDKAS